MAAPIYIQEGHAFKWDGSEVRSERHYLNKDLKQMKRRAMQIFGGEKKDILRKKIEEEKYLL